ncbi:hypothetical protein ACFU5O_28120 [Streptomyces sp. NPDC057445]|uniref:hypothetical protein n=1 Tax=Streptomyces sp. NPDC057445 TaxID=3346136 RepID=UPI0036A72DA8
MRWPSRPTISVENTLSACTSGLRDEGAKEKLEGRLADMQSAEEKYKQAGEGGTLLALLHSRSFSAQRADRDKELLIDTYETGLVGRKAGRELYDVLKSAAVHGKCPLCGIGQAHTLDHHAPKTLFPLLALAPLNLVPACGICNQGKSNKLSILTSEEVLHPYFDDLGTERWLFADVIPEAGVAAYAAKPPAFWSATKQSRVQNHFDSHDLAHRYAKEAAWLMSCRRRTDLRTFESAGPDGLREALQTDAESHGDHDLNGWDTALLHALAESEWYVNGGMKTL